MTNDSSPQFTRRHYIWLATVMREVLPPNPTDLSPNIAITKREAVERAIERFADALATDNPRFDKQKFLSNIYNHPTKD